MFIFIVGLVVFYLMIQAVYSLYFFRVGSNLSKTSFAGQRQLGEKDKPIFKLFVTGDSVGAGVGATSFEKSVVGRVGNYLAQDKLVQLDNRSISGFTMENVGKQKEVPSEKQNLIILIVSSNDLFHFSDLNKFKVSTKKVLKKYASKADKVILIGPGKVIDSPAIPFFIKPFYALQGPKYTASIKANLEDFPNVKYVNPLEPPKNMPLTGEHSLASDNFHPNDTGHEYWFNLIKSAL